MRSAKDFFKPKAIGAPEPPREILLRPSRMIHFFDPSNPKMAAKVPELAKKCDVLLGNLEDAIDSDKKVAAREGLIKIARDTDFGDCQLWTRVNSLDSPWVLDDITPPPTACVPRSRTVDGCTITEVSWGYSSSSRPSSNIDAWAAIKTRTSSVSSNPFDGSQRTSCTNRATSMRMRASSPAFRLDQ